MANRWGKCENSDRFYFLGLQNHCRWWLQPQNQKTLAPWKESYDKSSIKNQRHHFANKGPYNQSYSFFNNHVWVWVGPWEGWAWNNWCFWIVVLEKTLESPLKSKEIKPVNSKGNQPWIFIGRTDAEAAVSILWPPASKSQLLGKDLILGKLRTREEKEWQRMRWLDGITNLRDMSMRKLQ